MKANKSDKRKVINYKQEETKHWGFLPNENIFQYIKRIVTYFKWWTILSILVALPGAVLGCIQLYDYFSKEETSLSEERVMIESVMESVSTVESTFNFEDFPVVVDTILHPDVSMIREFKILCLDFANRTRELYKTPAVTKYKSKSFDELLEIEKSWDDKMINRREGLEKIIRITESIDSLGKKNHIDNYVINQSIYHDFLDAEEEVGRYSDEMRNQALSIYKKINVISEAHKDEFIKIISLQEKACKNIYIYNRDKKLFSFLITLNNNYDIQLKKYNLNQ